MSNHKLCVCNDIYPAFPVLRGVRLDDKTKDTVFFIYVTLTWRKLLVGH